MRAAIAAAKRPATVLSAQDSIPFERMFPDGICRVEGKFYSKTIQFQDINYQLSQNEDKDAIFDGWCDFLNYFDASVRFQFSFVNSAANKETYRDRIAIPLRGDEDDSLRAEYSAMLQDQLERGNNGLIKSKHITFGIEADGYKTAKPRLERIETDILNNFRKLGVKAEPLDGRARLALMHGIFHIDGQEQFKFSWDLLAPSGLSVKDFISPSSFEFASSKHFKMGAKFGAVSFLNILAPELNDRLLADLLDMDSSLVVSMHVKALDQLNAQTRHCLMGNLGIQYTYLTEGRVEATMPVDHRTRQPFGILHGGATLALAETVAGLGSMALCQTDEFVVGMQVSGNHVSSALEGDTVRAVGTVVHKGRSSHVWNVDVFTSTGKLVSTVRVVNSVMKKR